VEDWSPEKRAYYNIIRRKFIDSFQHEFRHFSKFERFTKCHDPVHEDQTIDAYGSLRNLDEMNFETSHQDLKRDTRKSNKRNLEENLLKKV
jgi:hypothetical protein